MAILLLACAAFLGTSYVSPLSLQLATPRATFSVGEPVRLQVTWSVTEPFDVGSRIHIFLARGDKGSFVPWVETSIAIATEIEIARRLEPGKPFTTAHVVSVSGRMETTGIGDFQLAFPEPGKYRAKVVYSNAVDSVSSNVVELTATLPQGPDRELLEQYIKPQPQLLTPWLRLADQKVVSTLLARYPDSHYLARSKVLWYEALLNEAMINAPDPARPNDPVEGSVPGLLQRLASESLGTSPFEEDRLVLLAEMTERSNRGASASRVWAEILARFPDSAGAQEAKRRIALMSLGQQ